MKKLVFLLALSALCLLPAFAPYPAAAVKNPKDEIVYRTNLGRADDVALLLKQGVSPDETDGNGVSLLALAASRKDDEGINVMEALLKAGAHIDAKDADGQTALFYAVKSGNINAVNFLLSKGANYYAVDKEGNTARNLAYTSGHKDIGIAIDDFVKSQSAERAAQYKKFNELMAKRFEAYKAVQSPRTSRPPPNQITSAPRTDSSAQPDNASANPEPRKTEVPVMTSQDLAAQQAAQQAAIKKRQDEIKQIQRDLVFNTCAFQYWSYVSDSKETTDLSSDQLDDIIDSYQDKTTSLEDQLVNNYHINSGWVKGITGQSEDSIFRELSHMYSNSYRFEHGVGKDEDMQSRCKKILWRWDRGDLQALPAGSAPARGRGGLKVRHLGAGR